MVLVDLIVVVTVCVDWTVFTHLADIGFGDFEKPPWESFKVTHHRCSFAPAREKIKDGSPLCARALDVLWMDCGGRGSSLPYG